MTIGAAGRHWRIKVIKFGEGQRDDDSGGHNPKYNIYDCALTPIHHIVGDAVPEDRICRSDIKRLMFLGKKLPSAVHCRKRHQSLIINGLYRIGHSLKVKGYGIVIRRLAEFG